MKARINQQGMTLIELMVVVVIVAIIASVAYPSYTRYVQDTRRTLVQGEMLEYAQGMERYFTQNSSYASAALPTLRSPRIGNNIDYNLALVTTATTYTITATPNAGSRQASDECSVLTLNEVGLTGASSGPQDCWQH